MTMFVGLTLGRDFLTNGHWFGGFRLVVFTVMLREASPMELHLALASEQLH